MISRRIRKPKAERYPIFISAILLACLSACATHVGSSIQVPEIPLPAEQIDASNSRARLDVTISIDAIKDVRQSVIAANTSSEQPDYTEPHGPVGPSVKEALTKAFATRGISVLSSSGVTVWGEVRRWRTEVDAKTTTRILSEASLYLEVLDAAGKRKYAGTYHGSRMSQFPVASADDIQDSLALSMTSAIEQVLEDEEFLSALW